MGAETSQIINAVPLCFGITPELCRHLLKNAVLLNAKRTPTPTIRIFGIGSHGCTLTRRIYSRSQQMRHSLSIPFRGFFRSMTFRNYITHFWICKEFF